MTFVDPRELRRRQVAHLRAELASATSDDQRSRIEAEIRELTKFRWRRFFWPNGPHGG